MTPTEKKALRKVSVKVTAVFTGEVSEGCEEAIIAITGQHLRASPLSVTDDQGDSLELTYTGGGRFRVEFDK